MKTVQIDFESTLPLAAVAGSFRQAMQDPPFMVKQRYDVEVGQDESTQDAGAGLPGFAMEMHADLFAKALKVMPGFASSLPGAPEGGVILQVDEAEEGKLVGTLGAYGSNRTIVKDARKALYHILDALSSRDDNLRVSDETTGRI